MRRKSNRIDRIRKIVKGGLRQTIKTHGPITKTLIGSAVKRIANQLLADEKDERIK